MQENREKIGLTFSGGKSLYCGSRSRSANSMYEQGTVSVMPSENSKEVESATVELCSKRPSGLTGEEENESELLCNIHDHL